MGLFKMLFNISNAEGIREAMRIAYRKQKRLAESGKIDSEFDPHTTAMLAAMASRMAVNKQLFSHIDLWYEVAPFLLIRDQEVSAEALAEYAVYVERTVDTKLAGLREALSSWVLRAKPGDRHLKLTCAPRAELCRWQGLLTPEASGYLQEIQPDLWPETKE